MVGYLNGLFDFQALILSPKIQSKYRQINFGLVEAFDSVKIFALRLLSDLTCSSFWVP